jgi:hypothetical protein
MAPQWPGILATRSINPIPHSYGYFEEQRHSLNDDKYVLVVDLDVELSQPKLSMIGDRASV